jgi:hypothetical protein
MVPEVCGQVHGGPATGADLAIDPVLAGQRLSQALERRIPRTSHPGITAA